MALSVCVVVAVVSVLPNHRRAPARPAIYKYIQTLDTYCLVSHRAYCIPLLVFGSSRAHYYQKFGEYWWRLYCTADIKAGSDTFRVIRHVVLL